MSTTAAPSDFQTRVRTQVRRDALDAAYRIVGEQGWQAVTMTAIAAEVGVSRQTLYKEFSSKQQLGEALLMREAEQFIASVSEHLAPYDDLAAAIEAALRFALKHAQNNRLLHTILSGGNAADSLLPLVTVDSQSMFTLARTMLREHIARRAPKADGEDAEATADALVRLFVSHLLQPLDDIGTIVRRLTRLAGRSLGIA